MLFSRKKKEADLRLELQFHRDKQLAKYLAAGLSEAEAKRRVMLDFGGVEQIKDECRDEWAGQLVETVLRDGRYGLRTLRRSPGFTAVALLTLALGIGANTAVFSILYDLLLRPLPYNDSQRLDVIQETTPKVGSVSVSYPNFLDWRAQAHSFQGMAFVRGLSYALSGNVQPEVLDGEVASSNFLSLLGIEVQAGRNFLPAEKDPVILISYHLWQSRFGGDRNAIGRVVSLDQRPFTIIGVLPADFRWTEKLDFLEPLTYWMSAHPELNDRGERSDSVVIARLAPGVQFETAEAEMRAIGARLAKAYPGTNDQFGVSLRSIRDVFVSNIRPTILVLSVAAFLVLLIACTNVGNLLLVRGIARSKEVSLRRALGATSRRIIVQMITESLLITALGGLGGLLIAFVLVRNAAHFIPNYVLQGATLDLNGPAIVFASAVMLLVSVGFGIAPALRSKFDLKKWAKTNAWRDVLVTAEVALALVLLIGAGLMMKSLYRLLAVDPGVQTQHVLTMNLSLGSSHYTQDAAKLAFWTSLLDKVRNLPGVATAAMGTGVPMTDAHYRTDISIEGRPPDKPGSAPHPDIHIVSAGYLQALGIPLLQGRNLTDFDDERGALVGLINARIARQLFPHTDPVGKRFKFDKKWITIAGVVGDTKLYGLSNPSRLEVYLPFRQSARGSVTLIVKSSGDLKAMAEQIRKTVAQLDPNLPIDSISTMDELVDNSVWTQRAAVLLLAVFSSIAVVLAAFGIYGIIAYSVAQRATEIGIRMALGAQTRDVLRLVMSQAGRITLVGGAVGLALSFGLTRLMTKLLYSVKPFDLSTFAVVTLALMTAALAAAYIPARRGTRIDPVNSLRCE